jgi:hypothetical protein
MRWRQAAVLLTVIAAVAAGSIYLATRSTATAAAPPAGGIPTAYHIVYRVSAARQTSTEAIWVDRPFESVQVDMIGAPPGSAAYLTLVNRLGAQATEAGNAQEALLERVPAAATQSDVRPDIVIQPALRGGLMTLSGHDRIASRDCTIYRTASSLRAGVLAAVGSGGNYTDTCIGADGLILRETTFKGGAVSSDRVAISVQEGLRSVDKADFGLTGPPTPAEQGGGAFRALTLTSRSPGINWTLGYVPPGFREMGRYAVIPPQPQGLGPIDAGAPNQTGSLPGSTVGATFPPPQGAPRVDLGSLGSGQIQLSGTGPIISAEPSSGVHFIRLSGTLPPETLLQVARSIVTAPPGTLTTIPPANQ